MNPRHRTGGPLLVLAIALVALAACAGPGAARQTAVADASKPSTRGAVRPPSVPLDTGDRGRGEQLFRAGQCVGCHAVRGTGGVVGPDLTEVGKRAPQRAAAQRLDDPRQYLVQSIVEPGAYVVEGFTPMMPDWRAQGLTEQDLADLAAFLNGLTGP